MTHKNSSPQSYHASHLLENMGENMSKDYCTLFGSSECENNKSDENIEEEHIENNDYFELYQSENKFQFK